MWKRSFVATAVALGDGVDDAIGAIASEPGDLVFDAGATTLVEQLRSPQRSARTAALANAVRDIVVAIDEETLR